MTPLRIALVAEDYYPQLGGVPEHVHNELPHDRVVCVERITNPRKIFVISAFILLEHVKDRIIRATEADCWTEFISFAGVVQDNIQNYFDSSAVKALDHFTEFEHLLRG